MDTSEANPKLLGAQKWLAEQVQLGRVGRDKGRLMRTALARVAKGCQDGLQSDALAVRRMLEISFKGDKNSIANELRKRELTDPSIASYFSRTRRLLDDYFRHLQDDEAFAVLTQTRLRPHEEAHCDLGNGRTFTYRLPPGGIASADIRRIAAHLWALSKDFDLKRTPWGDGE